MCKTNSHHLQQINKNIVKKRELQHINSIGSGEHKTNEIPIAREKKVSRERLTKFSVNEMRVIGTQNSQNIEINRLTCMRLNNINQLRLTK